MKCKILFSGKHKRGIMNLSSAESAQREVKVKLLWFHRLPLLQFGFCLCVGYCKGNICFVMCLFPIYSSFKPREDRA